jgi:hypothetical protein
MSEFLARLVKEVDIAVIAKNQFQVFMESLAFNFLAFNFSLTLKD